MSLKPIKNNCYVILGLLTIVFGRCERSHNEKEKLSDRDIVCIYFFYQNSFFNNVTMECDLISDSIVFYDVTIDKQYCDNNRYVVQVSSDYYKMPGNSCGYPFEIILRSCSDTIIDGYYGGTAYVDLYNKNKIEQNPDNYYYLDSIQRAKMNDIHYPFQIDSEKFIRYCRINKDNLSSVLRNVLKHKGYSEF